MRRSVGLQITTAIFIGAAMVIPSLALAEPDAKLLQRAEAYKEPVLKLLEKAVNQDSGSADEAGLLAVADLFVPELKALGAKIELVKPEEGGKANNVIASLEGSGRGKILIMAHMDTVFPKGEAAKRPFRIEGKRAYGPGVVDDKGGVVVGLFALKILKDMDFKNFGRITFLLNSDEEAGSRGSRALIEKVSKDYDVVLSLEPGRVPDGLVVQRKGTGRIALTIKGRSAHAGNAPDSGRNAAMELAHQALQIGKLGDRDKGTTVNVTVMKAGTSGNVIPDNAEAQGDVRAVTSDEFKRVDAGLQAAAQNKLIPDTTVTAALIQNRPPMEKSAGGDRVAETAQRIYGELGKQLTTEASGGGGDANFTAGVGVPSVDGFGIVGGELHTPDEFIEIDSIAPRLYLLTRMLMEFGPGQKT